MRRIRIFGHISLDGVVQSGDDGGFPHGDWTAPYRSPAGREMLLAAQGEGFDLLLGRRTYDIWSGFWPNAPRGPMADGLNAARKYVATHRPGDLGWGPVEALGPDIVASLRRIAAEDGPDLILWGSTTLTPVLLEEGLVHELFLITYPVVLGGGKRLFGDGTPARAFELVSSAPLPSGIVVSRYDAAGPLKTG